MASCAEAVNGGTLRQLLNNLNSPKGERPKLSDPRMQISPYLVVPVLARCFVSARSRSLVALAVPINVGLMGLMVI